MSTSSKYFYKRGRRQKYAFLIIHDKAYSTEYQAKPLKLSFLVATTNGNPHAEDVEATFGTYLDSTSVFSKSVIIRIPHMYFF